MEKSRAIELLKLAVPIKALTQQEYSDFVEAVNMGMDALAQPEERTEKCTKTHGVCLDAISRQAALDCVTYDVEYTTERIKALPSLQPTCNQLVTDCISRQAAIDAVDKIIERDTSGSNAVVNAMIAWSEYIRALPPAQPEPKEGHWILHESPDGGEQYECSECGVLWEFNDGTPEDNEAYFCPKCGKKLITKEKQK